MVAMSRWINVKLVKLVPGIILYGNLTRSCVQDSCNFLKFCPKSKHSGYTSCNCSTTHTHTLTRARGATLEVGGLTSDSKWGG